MLTNYLTLAGDLERHGVTLPKTVTDARATLLTAREAAAIQPLPWSLAEIFSPSSVRASRTSFCRRSETSASRSVIARTIAESRRLSGAMELARALPKLIPLGPEGRLRFILSMW